MRVRVRIRDESTLEKEIFLNNFFCEGQRDLESGLSIGTIPELLRPSEGKNPNCERLGLGLWLGLGLGSVYIQDMALHTGTQFDTFT